MSKRSERIYEAIKKSGYSYPELAKITGISKSSLQRYATGETEKIPVDCIEKIAEATNTDSRYLMCWENTENTGNLVNDDEELTEYLEELKNRPELRMIFSLTKNATKKDVEKAVKVIEAMLSEGDDD